MKELIGHIFDLRHAAGITRYRVMREHRDYGYFECVAVGAISGTHHFIGSIQIFSRSDIQERM